MHSSNLDGFEFSSAAKRAAASASAFLVCWAALAAMTAGSVGSGGGRSRFFFCFLGVAVACNIVTLINVMKKVVVFVLITVFKR